MIYDPKLYEFMIKQVFEYNRRLNNVDYRFLMNCEDLVVRGIELKPDDQEKVKYLYERKTDPTRLTWK